MEEYLQYYVSPSYDAIQTIFIILTVLFCIWCVKLSTESDIDGE